jgi:hypothetical protein
MICWRILHRLLPQCNLPKSPGTALRSRRLMHVAWYNQGQQPQQQHQHQQQMQVHLSNVIPILSSAPLQANALLQSAMTIMNIPQQSNQQQLPQRR